jgi:hypothetical protein
MDGSERIRIAWRRPSLVPERSAFYNAPLQNFKTAVKSDIVKGEQLAHTRQAI